MAKEDLARYFPFTSRAQQQTLIDDCAETLLSRKHLFANAPTGLGKTAATLSTALALALEQDLTVFFVTSRHTQHKIVLETIAMIRERFSLKVEVVDFIGKMWMCGQNGVTNLTSSEFSEYCRTMVEHSHCSFYLKAKQKSQPTLEARALVDTLEKEGVMDVDEVKARSIEEGMCPFEVSGELAKRARIVIADYYHLFHPNIRQAFFKRMEKSLNEAILIVDEAHNLPLRVRDLASSKLSTFVVDRAAYEARDLDRLELFDALMDLKQILSQLAKSIKSMEHEALVAKKEFLSQVDMLCDDDLDSFIKQLYRIGDDVLEDKKLSYLHLTADFLSRFKGPDEGFARIITKSKDARGRQQITLSYKCLDPSLVTREVFDMVVSSIVMSGTLHPPQMYRDLFGVPEERSICATYDSPFAQENRLSIIIPKTSTKFTARSPQTFEQIAKICAECCEAIPGNVAVFFPSYALLDQVYRYFSVLTKKTSFIEQPGFSKHDREELLSSFRSYAKGKGAVLFGVSGGSFSEGIDLPGSELLGVMVVGLPLTPPDLEMQSTVRYYDQRFGSGFSYGYLYPAFNKVLQSAGRCIRTETDKGVLIFLDERYTWQQYYQIFPEYLHVRVAKENALEQIKKFFDVHS